MIKEIHLGTDICQISRVEKAFIRYGRRFLSKTYTQEEIDYCYKSPKKMYERLAVRFATKEAVSKALGVGVNGLGWSKGIDWKDVEVARGHNGEVMVKVSGKAAVFASEKSINAWTLSVSHNGDYAVATVIGIVK